jgi:predicted kinase
MKLTLFLLLGYPGAGKTTFSKPLAEAMNFVRLNADDIRPYMYTDKDEMFDIKTRPVVLGALDYVAERLLQGGRSVIYDVNNNRSRDRIEKGHRLADKYDAQTVVLWIDTPAELAKEREVQRTQNPAYRAIPLDRYAQLVANLQPPVEEEKVVHINGRASFVDQLASFREQMEKLEKA